MKESSSSSFSLFSEPKSPSIFRPEYTAEANKSIFGGTQNGITIPKISSAPENGTTATIFRSPAPVEAKSSPGSEKTSSKSTEKLAAPKESLPPGVSAPSTTTSSSIFGTNTNQVFTTSSIFGVTSTGPVYVPGQTIFGSQSSTNLGTLRKNSNATPEGAGFGIPNSTSSTTLVFGATNLASGTVSGTSTTRSSRGARKNSNATPKGAIFGIPNSSSGTTASVFGATNLASGTVFGTSTTQSSPGAHKDSNVPFGTASGTFGKDANQVPATSSSSVFGAPRSGDGANSCRNIGGRDVEFGAANSGFISGQTWPLFPAQAANFRFTPANGLHNYCPPNQQNMKVFKERIENIKGQCCTDTIVKRENFQWLIKNFKFRTEKRSESIQSSTFISGTDTKYERYWQLDIYPNGYADLDPQLIPLKINLLNHDKTSETRVIMNVSIINSYHRKVRSFGDSSSVVIPETGVIYCENFLKKEDLQENTGCLAMDGTLTILFEVGTTLQSSTTSTRTKEFKQPKDSLRSFIHDYYAAEKFTDVTVEVDGGELKVHKLILAAGSRVFARLIDAEDAANREDGAAGGENRIKIDGIKFNVAKSIMEFIYTNKKPEKINELTTELMIAAQKYEIDGLRIMCEEILYNNITTDNATDTLIVASKHGIRELKDAIIQFIKEHSSMLTGQKLKELERNYPAIAMEVFQTIALDKTCYF